MNAFHNNKIIGYAKRNVTTENFRGHGFIPRKTSSGLAKETSATLINVSTSNALGTDEKYNGRKLYDENVLQWKHPFTCKYYYSILTQSI